MNKTENKKPPESTPCKILQQFRGRREYFHLVTPRWSGEIKGGVLEERDRELGLGE